MRQSGRAEYAARCSELQSLVQQHRRADLNISNARLLVGSSVIAVSYFVLGRGLAHPATLLVAVAVFVALVLYHAGVIRALARAQRTLRVFERALARVEGQWAGTGQSGIRFADESHPYAGDLDLFGKGSLFELLCIVRTRVGEDALARALLSHRSALEIRQRQAAIAELRGNADFRQELATTGQAAVSQVDCGTIAEWGAGDAIPGVQTAQRTAAVLAVLMTPLLLWLLAALLFTFAALLGISVEPPDLRTPLEAVAAMGAVNGLFALRWQTRIRSVLSGVTQPAEDLALIADLLRIIERSSFHSELLARLRKVLLEQQASASREIAQLTRLIELLDSRDNLALRLAGPPLLWTTQVALAVERWRQQHREWPAEWLATLGEFEALTALATYAYEHPADPFPDIVDSAPLLEGVAVGHPLLDRRICVRNDLNLSAELRLLVVSGSNMSGKSTFLRAIGVNAVLAMAGAPVCADRMRFSPMAVGASIQSRDSLQQGVSRFYAEVTRLREIKVLAEEHGTVLFLIDELLGGTNSHDRRIGAEAVVRKLLDRGGVGLVTTHDLALSRVADELWPAAANVHFADHIADGQMRFDYKLRPGIVHNSNAIELLRAADLL